MRSEARKYINHENFLSRIPYIGRANTIRFVDALYNKGTISAEITQIHQLSYSTHILELFITAESKSKRKVLDEIMKAVPSEIVETKKNTFRVSWDPVSLI
jgi:predicted nucleic acid-binding protein